MAGDESILEDGGHFRFAKNACAVASVFELCDAAVEFAGCSVGDLFFRGVQQG